VAGDTGPLRSSAGFTLETPLGLGRLETADLIAVPAADDDRCDSGDWPEPLLAALRRAVDRGARVLARMYPAAKVDPSVLYVDDETVITSARTAAGIDACLYLVRKQQGSRVANAIARRMVVPPHRDGGQAMRDREEHC
jgi:transcriptional regulator GlxA family with amidase domain